MYLAPLLTLLVDSLQQTFDGGYPIEEFRSLHVSIEFPAQKQNYPGVWVDFEPVGETQRAGIGHYEIAEVDGPAFRKFTRWVFRGHVTYTIAALTSFERARLHDEMLRVLAFGEENSGTDDLRKMIEDNPYLALSFDWDEIGTSGFNSAPGTPWGTDDMIYEITLRMECRGEYVSDHATGSLLAISAINVFEYAQGEPDPTTGGGWR